MKFELEPIPGQPGLYRDPETGKWRMVYTKPTLPEAT